MPGQERDGGGPARRICGNLLDFDCDCHARLHYFGIFQNRRTRNQPRKYFKKRATISIILLWTFKDIINLASDFHRGHD